MDEPADSRSEQIEKLTARIVELENSNAALWAWVRSLASQDSMLLTIMSMLGGSGKPEWAQDRDKMIDQIIDNNRKINNLPVPEGDE